jgi:glycylpeptide N-tetradecanoyltransferase
MPGFEWFNINVKDDKEVKSLYKLLTKNYVEDDDNMFRFDYSIEFLRWALTPPG